LITRGEFFMIKEMYERGMSFRYREGIGGSIGKPPENIFTPPIPLPNPSENKEKASWIHLSPIFKNEFSVFVNNKHKFE